jgi:hypothetical protein
MQKKCQTLARSKVEQPEQVIFLKCLVGVEGQQAISRKAEKLALAKLKVTQLKKQHQLERKMTELKFEKEMMEAQMEEERAAVRFIFYGTR